MEDQATEGPPGKVAFAKIFPPIGVARVGDSQSDYFLGPEFGPLPVDLSLRDEEGRIKRQAARFRLYGFDNSGALVGEITAADADISWTVHLANQKPAWFAFDGAAAARTQFRAEGEASDQVMRNAAVGVIEKNDAKRRFEPDAARRAMVCDPGPVTISGIGQGLGQSGAADHIECSASVRFGGAPCPLYLGEIGTDAAGRLVVLGGRGVSHPVDANGAVQGAARLNYWIKHYANNDHWIDDISDGPVTAKVKLKSGVDVDVQDSAWIIVAPPDFAPDITNLVTLFDSMEEVAIAAKLPLGAGAPTLRSTSSASYDRDIAPVLRRANAYRWVSPLGLRGHGDLKAGEFNAAQAAQFAQGSDGPGGARNRFARMLRKPTYDGLEPETGKPAEPDWALATAQANTFFMPPLSGDEGDRTEGAPETWLSVTRLQYSKFQAWADGRLPVGAGAEALSEPARLAQVTLEACVGGPYFPGIEITAIAREPSLYKEAFRFDAAKLQPGDITKFMACPWQADFYECRDAWWPAQRPDTVITDAALKAVADDFLNDQPDFDTLLLNRERWDRGLNRKPLPDRLWLVSQALPDPDNETSDAYLDRIAIFASGAIFDLTDLASFLQIQDDDDAVLPNPWRLQYTAQEIIDLHAGRFFTPRLPAPDAFLTSELLASKPLQALNLRVEDELRQKWTVLANVDRPGAAQCLKQYAQGARDTLLQYVRQAYAGAAAAKAGTPVKALKAAEIKAAIMRCSPDALNELGEILTDSPAQQRLSGAELLSALISILFFAHAEQAPDMAMIDAWRDQGFVRAREVTLDSKKSGAPIAVQVETERNRFDGKSFRDYFFYLMNLEQFPDFRSYVPVINKYFLDGAEKLIDSTTNFDPNHPESFVRYTPENFEAKLSQIYGILQAQAEQNQQYVYKYTRDETVASMISDAPFNQMDGSWLRYIANAGTMDDVRALLFTIWNDEIGNGDPSLHHGNLYTRLMESLGIHFPDIRSRAYAEFPGFFESSFVMPVFELTMSLESEDLIPELLGMTLFLEWEVLSLVPKIKQRDYLGIDSQFLRMHVGIDNPTDGHGASARAAVERYLTSILREGGDKAQQEHWARIWRGFVAFATAGYDLFKSVGTTLSDGLNIEREQFLRPRTAAEKVAELITRKAAYGSLNHLKKQLGRQRINDLFDDPMAFLEELAKSSWISPGRPDDSKLITYLTTFAGPMYKVFSKTDIELWRSWIVWLSFEGDTRRPKTHISRGEAMMILIADLKQRMLAAEGHRLYRIQGPNGTQSLIELFGGHDPLEIMRILKASDSGFVVPFKPAESAIIVDLLRPARSMGQALDQRFANLFDQIGRMVVYEWIFAGCPIPGEAPPNPDLATVPQPRERLLFLQQYGMGAVH